jgi:hypothetical protein
MYVDIPLARRKLLRLLGRQRGSPVERLRQIEEPGATSSSGFSVKLGAILFAVGVSGDGGPQTHFKPDGSHRGMGAEGWPNIR